MERGTAIVLSIIGIAVISALVIAFYQSVSTKVIGAQCDKTKKICQIQSETTHVGYFPAYSYYYVPFPLFGPGLGMLYPGSFIRPNVSDDCLTKVTPQDEQQVLNSKTRVPQSDLPSKQTPSTSGSNPGSSESGNPGEQSPSTSKSPPASSPGSSPSSLSESPPSEGGSGAGGESGSGGSGGGGAGEE